MGLEKFPSLICIGILLAIDHNCNNILRRVYLFIRSIFLFSPVTHKFHAYDLLRLMFSQRRARRVLMYP